MINPLLCRMYVFALFLLSVGASASGAELSKPITVFAAASLTDALNEVNEAFTKKSDVTVRSSYSASSALARQIESGAQADVFFSADVDWMDYLQKRHLLQEGSRKNILINRLVLIAPAASKVSLKIAPSFPLASTLGKGRLVTGDPDSVPVGRYARSALTNLGVWRDVSNRIVRADNVRVAMAYVARGEAALGIVYATDALIDKKVRVVDTFPLHSHAPIVYPLAMTGTASPNAAAYVEFVAGPEAAKIFKKYGFGIVEK